MYGTLFLEDGLEDGRPYKMSRNGEALHEVLNADTDHMVPITHIDDWISSANKMIQNRSMVGEDIFKYAGDFLSAVDRAKNFAQLDSELQVGAFKGSSGTHEGESIPPSGTEAKNLDDKEGEEHGGGNTDPIDESNKGGNENPPSKTKQRALVLANAAVHQNFAADYMPPVFPAVFGRNYFLHPEDPAAFRYTGVWVTATDPAVVGRNYYNHYSAPRVEVTQESSEMDKGDVTYDNSEGWKEDDGGEENHDNSEEGNKDDDGDKSDKNNEINNIKSSGGVNGLGTGCAAGDLCTMKNAPIAEPYHKCMNCCNLMHGGVCGVLWSERGVEEIDISIGKYAPLPFFYSHVCFFVSKFISIHPLNLSSRISFCGRPGIMGHLNCTNVFRLL